MASIRVNFAILEKNCVSCHKNYRFLWLIIDKIMKNISSCNLNRLKHIFWVTLYCVNILASSQFKKKIPPRKKYQYFNFFQICGPVSRKISFKNKMIFVLEQFFINKIISRVKEYCIRYKICRAVFLCGNWEILIYLVPFYKKFLSKWKWFLL